MWFFDVIQTSYSILLTDTDYQWSFYYKRRIFRYTDIEFTYEQLIDGFIITSIIMLFVFMVYSKSHALGSKKMFLMLVGIITIYFVSLISAVEELQVIFISAINIFLILMK